MDFRAAAPTEGLRLPSHAFLIATFSPVLAAVAQLAFHGPLGTWALLVWLAGLAPVFLLARYLGWKGALVGLAWTSAMVVFAGLFTALLDGRPPEWGLIGAVVVVIASVALGTGLERQWWARRPTVPPGDGTSAGIPEPCVDDLPTGPVLDYFFDKLFEAARRKPPLTIVLFQVDRYDEFVSMYGEPRACQALEVAVQALKEQVRASNMYGRLDERRLIVFLNGETLRAGYAFALRVLEEVVTLPVPWSGRVTLSAGVAAFETPMTGREALLARARQALDTARRMGGERVVVASGSTGEVLVTPGMTVVSPEGKVKEIRGGV
jgi:diguanylate cyclase (GGDEF)-like protein